MSMNETKLNQPYHFTVKTYAQRKDGKVPFTIETSIHLSADGIDTLGGNGDPVTVGIKKLQEIYNKMGYTEATKCDPPPSAKGKDE